MDRGRDGGVVALLVAVAIAATIAACDPAVVPTPPASPEPTQPPGPNVEPVRPIGELRLTLREPLPGAPIAIGYVGPDGEATRDNDTLPDRHSLALSRTFIAGTYALRVDGAACGSFVIEASLETDVDLTVAPAGCAIATVLVHGPELTHPDPADRTGAIFGSGPARANISLIPLNVAEQPQTVVSDESGMFTFDGLLPGRYRIGIAGDDGTAQDIGVVAGEATTVFIASATDSRN